MLFFQWVFKSMEQYFTDMWQLLQDKDPQGFLFFGALYAFLMCSYSLIYQIRLNKWPGVECEITEQGLSRSGAAQIPAEQNFVLKTLYSYTVDNITYKGHRISPWYMVASYNARRLLLQQKKYFTYSTSGKLIAFYNPKNPKKSFLIKTGVKSQFITFLIGIALPAVYIFRYIL